MRVGVSRPVVALFGLTISSIVAGCNAPGAPAASGRPDAWRIPVDSAVGDRTMNAVAAGLLAYLQDSSDGNRIAASGRAVCVGFGPAPGRGP